MEQVELSKELLLELEEPSREQLLVLVEPLELQLEELLQLLGEPLVAVAQLAELLLEHLQLVPPSEELSEELWEEWLLELAELWQECLPGWPSEEHLPAVPLEDCLGVWPSEE